MESESKGKFFLAHVKDKFAYTKSETFLLSEAAKITIRPDEENKIEEQTQA